MVNILYNNYFYFLIRTAENDDDDDVYEELPQDNNGLDNKAYGSSMPRNGQSVNDNDDDYDVIYSQPRP